MEIKNVSYEERKNAEAILIVFEVLWISDENRLFLQEMEIKNLSCEETRSAEVILMKFGNLWISDENRLLNEKKMGNDTKYDSNENLYLKY